MDVNWLQAGAGAAAGGFLTGSGAAFRSVATRRTNAGRMKFWKALSGGPISVVLTEYGVNVTSDDEEFEIAKSAAGPSLVSIGMAHSLATIQNFAETNLSRTTVEVFGDRDPGVLDAPRLVVIGSEVNNDYSQYLLKRIRERFDLTWSMEWDDEQDRVSLSDGAVNYQPEPMGKDTVRDYALVLRVALKDPDVELLIISGCHMYGSWAACRAVTSKSFLKVLEETYSAEGPNFGLIISTDAINGKPSPAKVERCFALS